MHASSDLTLSTELNLIREMTAAMLLAAKNARWKEVQRIDNARAKLLRKVPAEFFAADDGAVREILQDALSATRTIEQQAQAERELHGSALKNLNHCKNSAKAYGTYAQAV